MDRLLEIEFDERVGDYTLDARECGDSTGVRTSQSASNFVILASYDPFGRVASETTRIAGS